MKTKKRFTKAINICYVARKEPYILGIALISIYKKKTTMYKF